MNPAILRDLILVSGVGHLVLSAGSLFVPVALKWKLNLKNLPPLLRQMFWTYAAYILMINICFGLICLLGTDELLGKSILANSLHLMISGYWLIRIGIQFFYFDKTNAPKGTIYTLGEIVLVLLFTLFSVIHLIALFHD
jgi:hypothetical protein